MGKTGWLAAIPWGAAIVFMTIGFVMVMGAAIAGGMGPDYYEGNPAAFFAMMGPGVGAFVLAALVVHDGLEVGHLVRVLNLPEPVCRSVCRRLEGLGVLTSDAADQHYDIDLFWAPAVHRHLRRKHLLHRE